MYFSVFHQNNMGVCCFLYSKKGKIYFVEEALMKSYSFITFLELRLTSSVKGSMKTKCLRDHSSMHVPSHLMLANIFVWGWRNCTPLTWAWTGSCVFGHYVCAYASVCQDIACKVMAVLLMRTQRDGACRNMQILNIFIMQYVRTSRKNGDAA